MQATHYTVTITRKDGRYKDGFRTTKYDTQSVLSADELRADVQKREGDACRVYVGLTYATRTSLGSGKEYVERADTPVFLSASRETYWSM
jgi:hypothetical protein